MNLIEFKNSLMVAYPFRVELHSHTSPASSCGRATPEQVIFAYQKAGFDAIVIENHFIYRTDGTDKNTYIDRFLDDFYKADECGKKLGVKVYLGAEIRFTENVNDYLVFGVNRELLEVIYDLLPYGLANFRKEISMPDSLLVQAHPGRDGMEKVDPSLLDGVEIFNMHPNHNSRNGMTSNAAKKDGFAIVTAGSDFHHPDKEHEGLAALRAPILPEDSYGLAALLKSKNYLLELAGQRIILP
ncbi:MAG: transposase [Ruminococcaceae bacterium]|nr:transposase [Oscillospiraceae bacterium]